MFCLIFWHNLLECVWAFIHKTYNFEHQKIQKSTLNAFSILFNEFYNINLSKYNSIYIIFPSRLGIKYPTHWNSSLSPNLRKRSLHSFVPIFDPFYFTSYLFLVFQIDPRISIGKIQNKGAPLWECTVGSKKNRASLGRKINQSLGHLSFMVKKLAVRWCHWD